MIAAIGYLRVSSEDQADSLEAQRQRIRSNCELMGLNLAYILEVPAVSGGMALSTRPAGARLLALARMSKPVVVVAKFDRLVRSVGDADHADFDRRDIELVAIAERFDMTNPDGRAMAQMASVFAVSFRQPCKKMIKPWPRCNSRASRIGGRPAGCAKGHRTSESAVAAPGRGA